MPAPLTQEIDWLLAEAEIDYISLHLIMDAANDASDADPALSRMDRTLALLGRLLDLGFQAVDLTEGGKCRPWPDQRRASILARIERTWRAAGDESLVAMRFWFNLPEGTAAG